MHRLFVLKNGWMKYWKQRSKNNLILIGNKSDLNDKREIKVEDGEEKAKEFGIGYMEII